MSTLITYTRFMEKQTDGTYKYGPWIEVGRFDIEDQATFDRLLGKAQSWNRLADAIGRYESFTATGKMVYEYGYQQGDAHVNGYTRGRTGWNRVA